MSGDNDLLADLAAAPCGSRALDERIALELGWRKTPDTWDNGNAVWIEPHKGHHAAVPEWSTSMYAALTLVPNASKITPRLVLAFCDATLRARGAT